MSNRLRITLIATLLLTVVVLAIDSYRTAAGRESMPQEGPASQNRLIIKKTDFSPPVEIVKVKTRKGEIETGKQFQDDDDWIKGLTVELFNGSNKSLTYVDVEILFRHPEKSRAQSLARYGIWSLVITLFATRLDSQFRLLALNQFRRTRLFRLV